MSHMGVSNIGLSKNNRKYRINRKKSKMLSDIGNFENIDNIGISEEKRQTRKYTKYPNLLLEGF